MHQRQEGQLTDEKLKPGELTQEQLALLNNLMYLEDITKDKNRTLGYYLEKYRDNNYAKINNLPEGAADTTHEDWKKIIDAVANDEKLANMKITSTIDVDDKGSQAICISDSNYPSQATVVFRGTGSYEWLDNGTGGYLEETEQQERAKAWVDSLSKEYDSITASGHSKGGNKAEFVHILCDRVTRSVSFDGPGFGEEFFEKYKEKIEVKRDTLTLIAAQGDYVNILFFSMAGTKVYTKSDNSFIDRITNSGFECNVTEEGTIGNAFQAASFIGGVINAGREHCASTFLTFKSGAPKFREAGEQDPAMKLLHEYVIYVTKYGKKEDKEYLFKVAMNLLQGKEQKANIGPPPEGFQERIMALSKHWIDNLNITENKKCKLINILSDFLNSGTLSKSEADQLNEILLDIDAKMCKTSTPTFGSSIIRDFSEGARAKLIEAIKDVEGDNPLQYQKWPQWHQIDDSIRVKLDIDKYHRDINTYYEYLIEKNNSSIEHVNEIFDMAYKLDNNHSNKLKEQAQKLKDIEASITKLTQSFDISSVSVMYQK